MFGCRRADDDYIYRDEIAETQAALGGKLRVVMTFSRQPDQPRVYVQERIGEVGDDVVRLLEEGPICMCVGEATRRPKGWEEEEVGELRKGTKREK
jgi:NADPH-ferrihemoprotein reductase